MDRASRAPTSRPFAASQLSPLWLGWLVLSAVVLAAWIPQLFPFFNELAHPGAGAEQALREALITAHAHAAYHVGLDVVFGLGAIVVAALILRRSHGDQLAVSAAGVLTVWGPLNGLIVESMGTGAWWARGLAVFAWCGWAWLIARSLQLYRSKPALDIRQRIRWLWYGAATSLVVIVVVTASIGSGLTLDPDQVDRHMTGHLLLVLGGALSPCALGAAWLLPALPDPDTLIRRTIVYAALASIALGLTIGFVVLPALLYFELGIVYFLALVCAWAVLGIKVQEVLQRTVNRLLFGQRDEPMTVLNDLGNRLELGSPETVLNTIVETVATTLKLPAVAIRAIDGDEDLAAVGQSDLTPFAQPIFHQSQQVGRLVAYPRARDEPLHERDHEILRLVARQAGPTVRAVQLNQELRRSRQQILISREEERRRIRRDLHDGLGPALAAIAMQADTARAVVDENPAAAREILVEMTKQAEDVVHEVRRLVYDLRPPALDELGLLGAIERLARQNTSASLRVDLAAPKRLPTLDAALEVAVFRITAEALANVVRHSHAVNCAIRIEVTGEVSSQIHVTIDDDGVGIDDEAMAGIGLPSMRERAGEVGGSLTIARRPQGGTRVAATFPLTGLGGTSDD